MNEIMNTDQFLCMPLGSSSEELPHNRALDNSPDWRWNRIKLFVGKNRPPSSRFGDKLITRGCRYLHRYNKLEETEDQLWLQMDYPDLFGAHMMFSHPESERWIIEAGILAGAGDDAIAEYTATTADVVRAYHDYFFSIRDKDKAKGYIQNRLMRPAMRHGASGIDPDLLLKMAAWGGGWQLVQDFLDFRHVSMDSVAWLKTAFLQALVKKGWISVQCMDPNKFSAIEMLNTVLRYAELEFNASQAKLNRKDGEAQESQVFEGLRSLLNSVQTGILRPERVVGDELRALTLVEADHGKDGQGH